MAEINGRCFIHLTHPLFLPQFFHSLTAAMVAGVESAKRMANAGRTVKGVFFSCSVSWVKVQTKYPIRINFPCRLFDWLGLPLRHAKTEHG